MTFLSRDADGNDVLIDSETINGKETQRNKIVWGGDGVANIVDAATGLPVQIVSPLPAGGNVIGHIVVDQLPALPTGGNTIGTVDVASDPVLRTIDAIATALQIDALMNGLTALPLKRAFANVAASSTDAALVAAVGGKKIHVVKFRVHAGATATDVTFNSKPGGAGVAITEKFAFASNSYRQDAPNPWGEFVTNIGEGLSVTTGTGATTGIGILYLEV